MFGPSETSRCDIALLLHIVGYSDLFCMSHLSNITKSYNCSIVVKSFYRFRWLNLYLSILLLHCTLVFVYLYTHFMFQFYHQHTPKDQSKICHESSYRVQMFFYSLVDFCSGYYIRWIYNWFLIAADVHQISRTKLKNIIYTFIVFQLYVRCIWFFNHQSFVHLNIRSRPAKLDFFMQNCVNVTFSFSET